MTKPVDLDALDAAHAAATPGEWSASIPFPKFDDAGGHVFSDFNELSSVCSAYRAVNAHSIATLHNAYPAMAAELRERRARDGEMVRLLRAALKSLIALREGYVAYLEIVIDSGDVDEVNECDGDEQTIADAEAQIAAIEQFLAKKGGV